MSGPPDIDTALSWRGRTVRDQDGNELGTLSELYLDSETSRPAWAGVKRGRLRTTETIVPLADATEDGEELRVPFDRALRRRAGRRPRRRAHRRAGAPPSRALWA